MRSVTACLSASTSRRHAPSCDGRNGKRTTRAPRIAGCAVRFGQTGTTATTSSPATDQRLHRQHQRAHARRRHGDAVAVDGRMQGARVAGDGFAQLGEAEVVRVEGLAVGDRLRCGVADGCGVGSSLSPNQNASTSLRPIAAFATSRIFEAGKSSMSVLMARSGVAGLKRKMPLPGQTVCDTDAHRSLAATIAPRAWCCFATTACCSSGRRRARSPSSVRRRRGTQPLRRLPVSGAHRVARGDGRHGEPVRRSSSGRPRPRPVNVPGLSILGALKATYSDRSAPRAAAP